MGICFTVAREYLLNNNKFNFRIGLMIVSGIIFEVCFFGGHWIIIPQWNNSQYVVIPLIMVIPVWVMSAHKDRTMWRPFLWSVWFWIASACAIKYEVATYFVIAALFAYSHIWPGVQRLHIDLKVVRSSTLKTHEATVVPVDSSGIEKNSGAIEFVPMPVGTVTGV
jgi:hypothetical protein